MPISVNAYGLKAADAKVEPLTIKRRDLLPRDVRIDIGWSGICGTDVHIGRNDWGRSTYPVVPGHEIVGKVTEVGSEVTKHKVGDTVAVGCMIDSCRDCAECDEDHEQQCLKGRTSTYNSPDPHLPGQMTYGGYSEQVLVDEHFVIKVPESLSSDPELLKAAAPIACAGITTWVPLRQFNVGPGKKVGVVGLGGLGHMAVKLAVALGAEVTLITRSHAKDADARRLGIKNVVASTSEEEMTAAARSQDLIIDTVPFDHDVNVFMPLVRSFGALVIVGHIGPLKIAPLLTPSVIMGNKTISGSLIGGIKDTQDVFDFCGKHKVVPDVEVIKMSDVNTAWSRLDKSDVKYRFVIDINDFKKQSKA